MSMMVTPTRIDDGCGSHVSGYYIINRIIMHVLLNLLPYLPMLASVIEVPIKRVMRNDRIWPRRLLQGKFCLRDFLRA